MFRPPPRRTLPRPVEAKRRTGLTEVHPPLHLPHHRLSAPQHSPMLHTSSSSRFLIPPRSVKSPGTHRSFRVELYAIFASKELYLPPVGPHTSTAVSTLRQHLPSSAPRTRSHPFMSLTCNPSQTPPVLSLRYLSLMCFRIRLLGLGIEHINGKSALPRHHPCIG